MSETGCTANKELRAGKQAGPLWLLTSECWVIRLRRGATSRRRASGVGTRCRASAARVRSSAQPPAACARP